MSLTSFYTGKTAIVTGAASGIGRAIAAELIAVGSHVILVDINEEALTQFSSGKSNAIPVVCDVSNYNELKRSFEQVLDEVGKVDLLFTVAGIGYAGQMEGYTKQAWDKIVDININGVVNSVQLIYPSMKEQQSGSIINVASIAGLVPSGLLVPYATTKHAVVGLSKSLRLESELNNVSVHLVYPGAIDTNMLDKSYPEDMPESARINAKAYLSKITGKPRSSADLAKYIRN